MPRKKSTRPKGSGGAEIAIAKPIEGLPEGLTTGDLVESYTQMILVRTIDERIWALNRQGKVPIAASCQGHEAAQLGSLLAAQKDGRCFLFPYYRDLGLKMAAGLTPIQVMLSFMGKEGEPYSNARQFPLQGADLEHNIIQISNVVGAGLTQAVGYAMACRMQDDDTVVLTYFGDGASSQGEAHEAMNFAGVHRVPVVFICENNHYAISVPQHRQMATDGGGGIEVGDDILRTDGAARTEEDELLHQVAQLTHIARPVVLLQQIHGLIRHTFEAGAAPVAGQLSDVVLQEQGYVTAAIAQRRQRQLDDLEPIVEVTTEFSAGHRTEQILVAGRQHAYVHRDRTLTADAGDPALLENAQQAHLCRQ